LDAALIGHEDTDQSPELVVAIIRDQHEAIEGLYRYVSGQRQLSTSYIKELHRVLTTHQDYCDAIDSLGNLVKTKLLKGVWKKMLNNIRFDDGSHFEFCPPEQVDGEVERLLFWHAEHTEHRVPPEVESAWLHHRFTLIHPFQDGNGRIARCLATLVLLKEAWFPLVITRDDRVTYTEALRSADKGDLKPLIALFALRQQRAIHEALSLADEVRGAGRGLGDVIAAAEEAVQARGADASKKTAAVFALANALHEDAYSIMESAAQKLQVSIGRAHAGFAAFVVSAKRPDPKAEYNYIQIVQCAKAMGYFANLTVHRAWCLLCIQMAVRTEILISFHGIGHGFRGVLGCSAMYYAKETMVAEDGHLETRVSDVRPLSPEPFVLAYTDKPSHVLRRFRLWLDTCLVEGLNLWRKGL
jgi:fido (protein-threonine AMPylation protein)